MKNSKGSEGELKSIEKLVKPSVVTLILGTLVCLGPYGHLILKIIEKGYNDLLLTTLLVFPTLILLSYYWFWYVNSRKTYKKLAKEIFEQLNKD